MANLLDPQTLASFRELQTDTDPNFVKDYFNLFLDDIPIRIRDISAAIQNGDAAAISLCAHALKSSSANSGAFTLRALCEKLETVGASGKLSGAPELLKEIVDHSVLLKAEILSLPELKKKS